MSIFKRELDPYKWRYERMEGRHMFMIRHGVLPGFVAGIAFAALMLLFDNGYSVYFNGIVFACITTPVYLGFAWVMWETNEDAFAQWVVDEAERLQAEARRKKLSA